MKPEGPLVEVVVTQVAGSAPTAVGDSLYLGASGWRGSVGGGAIEEALKTRAVTCREQGIGAVVEFSLNSEHDQCCGGRVAAIICPIPPAAEPWLQQDLPRLYGWDHRERPRLMGAWWQGRWHPAAADPIPDPAVPEWPAGLRVAQSGTYFWKRAAIRHPLWLFGAGHVSAAIAAFACRLGYDVSVFDTRLEWNNAERFPPGATRHIAAMPPAEDTSPPPSALVMTHSHGLDFAITTALLARPIDYLGVIGSRTKAALFRKRLRDHGYGDKELAKLHMPMGFPGLGKKPYEVAVAVLAELLQRRQGGMS